MMRSRTRWWAGYASASVIALAALAWFSLQWLQLEDEKRAAQSNAQQASAMRLALWRMDSWLGPQLAHEAARPYFEYLAFVPNERAYTRLLSSIEPGEVLSPSPLLGFDSEFFPLHFQVDEQRGWTSPQVPTGNQLDIAQGRLVESAQLDRKRALFEEVKAVINPSSLALDMGSAEVGYNQWIAPSPEESAQQALQALEQQAFGDQKEFTKRVQSNIGNQNMASRNFSKGSVEQQGAQSKQGRAQIEPQVATQYKRLAVQPDLVEPVVSVGPLLPIWIDSESAHDPFEIYFLRRVEVGGKLLLQGFVGNWKSLRTALLSEIEDLFTGAEVRLARGDISAVEFAGELLAAIPARLEVVLPPAARRAGWTPAKGTLALAWLAALAGIAGLGFALRASIAYGEKRSRFASSVTHELRTPLTTFRMYTEMLAKDMVPTERRSEYLQTLQRESDRLAHLVENVLSYARLEDGKAQLAKEVIAVCTLLERIEPILMKRAEDGGHRLSIAMTAASQTQVKTDVGAVEQILFNLVDNACKYGSVEETATVQVEATVEGDRLWMCVQDRGRGVPAKVAHAIFRPFDRGAVAPADPSPGIGLGLALCRALARDLGGDLEYLPGPQGGARFGLWLPL